jgi:hypothetical protein
MSGMERDDASASQGKGDKPKCRGLSGRQTEYRENQKISIKRFDFDIRGVYLIKKRSEQRAMARMSGDRQ